MLNKLFRDTSGAALVEAALILPVLILLICGISDVTLYLWQWSSANKAVLLGVRKSVVSDSVAAGPGLTVAESSDYWNELPLGKKCLAEGDDTRPCPAFVVRCSASVGCRCASGACGFSFVRGRLSPILEAMRGALSQLEPEQVQVTYATNTLGYVGRPVPVPVDVTVSIVSMDYQPMFLASLLGPSLPIRASATLPSEALTTFR